MMARMRTIDQAINELKLDDPGCALTKHALRQIILSKRVPFIMVGNKYLVNLDALQDFLCGNALQEHPPHESEKIRQIPEKLK